MGASASSMGESPDRETSAPRANSASAGTTASVDVPDSGNLTPNYPSTLDPTKLSYGRQQVWGDKLLRRLNSDQVARYLAEKPFVSPALSITQHKMRVKRSKRTKSKLSPINTVRQNVQVLATEAKRRASRSNAVQVAATTDVSDDTYQRGNKWVVPGVGEFSNKAVYTFTGNTLPAGLTASDNNEQQGTAPYPFRFDSLNVTVSDGTLNLRVAGGQDGRKKPISCAEVTTDESAILHASIRMTAKMSAQAGVCHGAFFYRSDQDESDIEYLTDPTSQSNRINPNVTQFWYTNQAKTPGGQASHQNADPPPSVEGYHAYRLDWAPEFTAYYVDSKLQSKLTDNVPNKSGMWVWNNWSNGDPGWSCGPPKNDSVFRIKDITMYYNTLSS